MVIEALVVVADMCLKTIEENQSRLVTTIRCHRRLISIGLDHAICLALLVFHWRQTAPLGFCLIGA